MAASMGMGRKMIDWTKPIETVDGREARFIGPEPLASLPEARIVHVKDRKHAPLSCGDVFLVNNKGYRCDDRALFSARQEPFIRNVRVKRVAWVLKREGINLLSDYRVFETEKNASDASSFSEEVIRIEWEEEP